MAKKKDTGGADPNPAVNDAYTGMLAIALLALVGGSTLLALDYLQYDQKTAPVPAKSAPAAAPVAVPMPPPGEPAKDPPKEAAKDPPKEAAKDPPKEAAKDPPKEEKKEKEEKKD